LQVNLQAGIQAEKVEGVSGWLLISARRWPEPLGSGAMLSGPSPEPQARATPLSM
jgi:hypothetical protein